MTAKGHGVSFWGNENVLKSDVMAAQLRTTLKTIELCSLSGRSVWYVSYSTIKLLKKRGNENLVRKRK